jgi:hypothetical protein
LIRIVEPDYQIHIGVKDGEVVDVDWSEIRSIPGDSTDNLSRTISHLRDAILFIAKGKDED